MLLKGNKWLRVGQDKSALRKAGDAARDARDWEGAQSAYSAYLEANPNDFPIWIQLGHSFKEAGKLGAAEEAYRKALAVKSDDEDGLFQLAHLLKRRERLTESAELFSKLFKQTGSKDAYNALVALKNEGVLGEGENLLQGRDVASSALLIEIDDMMGYLEAHKTLSGIQRVQAEIIQHVVEQTEEGDDQKYVFVLNPINENRLLALNLFDLAKIVTYVTSPRVNHDRLKELVRSARDNAVPLQPVEGQAYFVLGAFWGYGGVSARYAHLKRAGVMIGAYIYDLIPITNPEYCDRQLAHEFTLSLGDGLTVFDFILTISEYTAREVKRYMDRLGLPPVPIEAVPLAHATTSKPGSKLAVWGANIEHLKDRPFALMVSTVEARKNHIYLINAWKQYIDEGLDPPDLVFVGRYGWRITGLMEMLETTGFLDGRVHLLHDLSDAELQTLYANCLFTAFPSFIEGWGLPVGEGLAHGAPCVASSTSSIPEVGGDLVDYIDPHNLRDGIQVFRKMIFDNAYRDSRRAAVQQRFVARTWREVGSDLIQRVGRLRLETSVNRTVEPLMQPGTVFRPGDLAFGNRLPDDYAKQPMRLMMLGSWYFIEDFGSWMRGNEGTLAFRTPLAAGTAVVVYLKLISPGHVEDCWVSATIGKIKRLPRTSVRETRIRPETTFLLRADGVVDPEGLVVVSIKIRGTVQPEHEDDSARYYAVALTAIGYADRSDVASRLDVTDEMLLG